MKIKSLLALLSLVVLRLSAETLTADVAVFAQPDAKGAVITRLKAGATISYVGEAPAGWRRVEIAGEFEGYAHAHDITKGLEVREGANILAAPEKGAPVLTVAQKGDKSDVTGLHGEYCQIRFEKTLQGFVATGATANLPAKPAIASPAKPTAMPAPAPTPSTAASPVSGTPVPTSGNAADLPRMFSGTLVAAKRLTNPNPLYDYQLTDSNGRRFAYLDTKRLVLTNKMETYLDLQVVISGTIRNTVDGKDLVIEAQSIQRKQF